MRAREFKDKLDHLIAIHGDELEVILFVDESDSEKELPADISFGEGSMDGDNALVVEPE